MWTKDYSIRLSVFFTRLFLVLLAAGLFLAPHTVAQAVKTAVFAAKAAGVADQGAVAGMYMIQGLKRGLEGL